jgi:hypothetical protein
MPDGSIIRLSLLVVLASSAAIAAVLGFAEYLDQTLKIVLVGVNAGLIVIANQLSSWQSAPKVERMRKEEDATP